MNVFSLTFRSKYTAIHTDGTYCIVHRHTFTHQALPVTDVGRNIARKKSSFISFYSLCILACLSLYTVWPCHRSYFFFLQAPLCTFNFFSPYVIIMKLKSFVPREIRRESGKARGTLAKIFLSVMS